MSFMKELNLNFERSHISKHVENERKVLGYIEKEAASRKIVIPEGPPVYLWPFKESHEWNSGSFINGWKMVNNLSNRIPLEKTEHFVLVDDFNNRPEGITENHRQEQLRKMGQTSEILAQSPIFLNGDGKVKHAPIYRFLESAFLGNNETNQCSRLDAGFQKQKIIHQLENGKLSLGEMERALLVVFHPEDFRKQQQMMLRSLVKEEPFNQIPNGEVRDLFSNMYRHVWLNNEGHVTQVTQPVWHKKNFEHKNILSL